MSNSVNLQPQSIDFPTKSVKVAFHENVLPAGTYATFTRDKQLWIAWPLPRHRAHEAIVDRLIGSVNRLRNDLVAWINDYPDDAVKCARALDIINRANTIATEALTQKMADLPTVATQPPTESDQ
ncbi:hypothetical protein [Mycolicibacterium sphagni]|uniref:hypothetical protein n=1 Tax=Mycolicibacterium sphagni TaxID=1786 RepID=UPI0021F3B328|nr:hypothetical protein [Mycolicibacterium sphagni]MCV7175106.1 hypothetical protein [Mycolicibacterium sphagni]